MARPTGFIDFEIVGNRQGVQFMLDRIDSALSPVGLAAFLHGSVAPWLEERAEQRFAKQGDDASGRWAPLKPITVEIREEEGYGPGPINQRTHELRDYILGVGSDVTAGPGLASLTFPGKPANTQRLKTKVETAQKGKARPATVKRPVLAVNERDLGQVLTSLAFFIRTGRPGR